MSARPKRITIEITRRCNLKCSMCSISLPDYKYTDNDFFEERLFDKIKKYSSECESIFFFGIGEPLLHKNILSYSNELNKLNENIKIGIVSNGQLINKDFAQEIVSSKITSIGFSFDGFNIERGHQYPEKTLQGISLLQETKKKNNSQTPGLSLAVVVGKDNFDQLQQIIDTALSIGIKNINFDGLAISPYLSGSELNISPSCFKNNRAFISPYIWSVLKYSRNKNVTIGHSCTGGLLGEHRLTCPYPGSEMVIGLDGHAYPCNVLYATGKNVYEEDIESIWLSNPFEELKSNVKNHVYKGSCVTCHIKHQIEEYRKSLLKILTKQQLDLFDEIVTAGEFEETHYRNAYDDIPPTLEGAAIHYMTVGRQENRPATLKSMKEKGIAYAQ